MMKNMKALGINTCTYIQRPSVQVFHRHLIKINNCFLIHMYKIYQIGLYVKYYNQFALNPTPSATKHRQGRFGILRHIFRSL